MKWNDAAENVLRNAREALHYKELARKIIGGQLVETSSKSPETTLHACISQENEARQDRGIPVRFTIERGMVSLSEWEAPPRQERTLTEELGKRRTAAKTDLMKRLRQLPGDRFESYVEALVVKMGYENVEARGGPGDEGIDLLCEMSQGINQVKTAVQAKCKQAQNKVSVKDVRLLRDVLPKFRCSQGVLITTSGFTKEAEEAATEEGRLPIILIDGDRLAELALEHEVGVKAIQLKAYVLDDDFELWPSSGAE